ncbi:unnamed protein product [Rhizophagus irregularis]|nr:unnamed protein product [Rhizophagus irregularis]
MNNSKKEIWVGLQDLSKAYDRVNLSLLKLAFQRLCFLPFIVNLLILLFTDHTNSAILSNDTSSPIKYSKKIIYTLLQSRKLTTSTNHHLNYPASVVGYLDDTSWFAFSKEQLECNLNIAIL